MKRIVFLLLIVSSLLSCRTTPKVMRYYKKELSQFDDYSKSDSVKKFFTVNTFLLDPEVGGNMTIKDLSDRGQGSMIGALNSKTANAAELLSSIAQPIKSSSVSSVSGGLLWKKRIVLNILKEDKERANRMQYILFTFKVPETFKDKIEFVSWDKIATATQIIDLGKITAGGTTGFSFSPEITLAGAIQGKLPAAVSGERTFSEEKTFISRLAGLNAAVVSKSEFQVFRQAVPNEDITGNVVVELTMRSKLAKEVQIFSFAGLFVDGVPESDHKKIRINRTLQVRPDFTQTAKQIPLQLSYKFRYRIVKKGGRTEPEYDDHVKYQDGDISDLDSFFIFSEDDSEKVKTWEISDGTNYLHIKKSVPEHLTFDSYSDARQLLQWIKETSGLKIADYDLNLGLNALTKSDIDKLLVVLTK